MEYRVQVVEDWELPQGTDWVITHECGRARLLVKRRRFEHPESMCRLLGEAWTAAAAYGLGFPLLPAAV